MDRLSRPVLFRAEFEKAINILRSKLWFGNYRTGGWSASRKRIRNIARLMAREALRKERGIGT